MGSFYFQVGALDNVTLGKGILVNRYTNTILYPQVRKVGMDIKFKFSDLIFMVLLTILRRSRPYRFECQRMSSMESILRFCRRSKPVFGTQR